ncbi:MAG: anti-sigma factor family protein [Wujia sp.]
MTCLEAQSNIMAFIDKKLPDDKITDFVRHIRHCPNCAEELEIYYTLIVGIRQVDNNEELSQNFKEELNAELGRLDNKVKKAKRFKLSSFGVVFVCFIFAFIFFYNKTLNKVYRIEQDMMKAEQGIHYFYDYYKNYIDLCSEDIIEEYNNVELPEEPSLYEKIHVYNLIHANDEEENQEENSNE